ncbi:hypothetical protein [Hymenobacter guriensis]|uniref:Uncharacterized protein n=1 Tax=Hymenobacter guriensis TaxID=2793065 RepID=A0ABS0L4R3_9BACT|nr:hypothetical protein [Hymenobacter guriensis]MBG8555064.1 hypothetical protein [Hymenobacter guriensis]
MASLSSIPVIRLNPEADQVDLVFLTTSQALRRRNWDPEAFEIDTLGFPNELSGQDYPIVMRLQGPLDNLTGGWLPEVYFHDDQPLEPVRARDVQDACNSLRKAQQVWLKADESRDLDGQLVSGILYSKGK